MNTFAYRLMCLCRSFFMTYNRSEIVKVLCAFPSLLDITKCLSAKSVNLYSHKKQMRIPHSMSYPYLVLPIVLIFVNLLSMKLYVALISTFLTTGKIEYLFT